MKEIFIIYNRNTGFLEGGAGKIDRDWDAVNADGSTISERITEILAKDSDKEVIYLPNQKVPNSSEYKVVGGRIVELTDGDKQAIEDARPETDIELLKRRVAVLEVTRI